MLPVFRYGPRLGDQQYGRVDPLGLRSGAAMQK